MGIKLQTLPLVDDPLYLLNKSVELWATYFHTEGYNIWKHGYITTKKFSWARYEWLDEEAGCKQTTTVWTANLKHLIWK